MTIATRTFLAILWLFGSLLIYCIRIVIGFGIIQLIVVATSPLPNLLDTEKYIAVLLGVISHVYYLLIARGLHWRSLNPGAEIFVFFVYPWRILRGYAPHGCSVSQIKADLAVFQKTSHATAHGSALCRYMREMVSKCMVILNNYYFQKHFKRAITRRDVSQTVLHMVVPMVVVLPLVIFVIPAGVKSAGTWSSVFIVYTTAEWVVVVANVVTCGFALGYLLPPTDAICSLFTLLCNLTNPTQFSKEHAVHTLNDLYLWHDHLAALQDFVDYHAKKAEHAFVFLVAVDIVVTVLFVARSIFYATVLSTVWLDLLVMALLLNWFVIRALVLAARTTNNLSQCVDELYFHKPQLARRFAGVMPTVAVACDDVELEVAKAQPCTPGNDTPHDVQRFAIEQVDFVADSLKRRVGLRMGGIVVTTRVLYSISSLALAIFPSILSRVFTLP